MQKIMFNERYGLQSAVFDGRKTQTRREPFYAESVCCEFNRQGKLECFNYDDVREYTIHTSRYAKGEIVAIAERYNDSMQDGSISSFDKGWKNKMFVKAELMPHHIKITNIRCERLQDISDDDCIKEGVEKFDEYVEECFMAPRQAFSCLIQKLNGKKFFDSNPYVIVYEFEKIG